MNYGIIAAAAAPAGGSAAAPTACGEGSWVIWVFYAAILGICWLILIRPQKKKREQDELLRKSIEVGDEIVTIGGICGRVVSIKEDETIVVETGADRNKLKMKLWAVSTNITAKSRQPEPTAKKGGLSGLFAKKETPED